MASEKNPPLSRDFYINSAVGSKTFSRDSYMHHTWKGIYLKFRSEGGTISNILYENILLDVRKQSQSFRI